MFTNYDDLAIVALKGANDFALKVNDELFKLTENKTKETFMIDADCPRFGSGEGKGVIKESVRGKDLYILVDVCNYSITYKMFGEMNRMSPDDHYEDLKRIIAACDGKPRRITVIMPFLYEGRQHKRNGRESLDCAMMLHELCNMGVSDIITFDAHDARVQNAIPLNSFDNIMANYQFMETLCTNVDGIKLNKDNIVFISPDEGAIHRSVYFANILGVSAGMFYKRRDYSKIENGRNPIVAHEFLGEDLCGKDAIVTDDMISSGDSMIDTCRELKARGARRIFIFSTFGLFTNGMEKFDKAYEEGLFDKILTTNLIYTKDETLKRDYYLQVKMEHFLAQIIQTLNLNQSIAPYISCACNIKKLVEQYQ